jgi:transcriptional regulator with XRE-family HTH domain
MMTLIVASASVSVSSKPDDFRNLADAAELDRTFIGMLERGQRQPTLESLFRIAAALKVAPQTLIARTAAELE